MADKQSRVVVEKTDGERTEFVAESLEEAMDIEAAPKIEYDPDSPFHWTVQRDAKKLADAIEQSHEVKFGHTGGDNTLRIADKPSGTGALTVKVDVDVSEALTGLKALQREAREATKALRELEAAQKRSQALPRVPFVHQPVTPPHIKKYGKGESWTIKDGKGFQPWFKDGDGE